MRRLPTTLAMLFLGAVSCRADDIGRGRALAQLLCSGCHLMEGLSGRGYQGAYVPTLPEIAARRSIEQLKELIAFPHRPMPGFPLRPSEIDDLAAYIHSLNGTGQ